MNDLISRAALLKECAECQKTDPHFEERGWASHFINDAGEPSTEWYCVEDMIENAPAIDAIPVEWLQYMQQECLSDNDRTMVGAIEAIFIEWHIYVNRLREMNRQKEQEDA